MAEIFIKTCAGLSGFHKLNKEDYRALYEKGIVLTDDVNHQTDDPGTETILNGLCYVNEEGRKTYYVSVTSEKILLKKDNWLGRLSHFKLHPPLSLNNSAWGLTNKKVAPYKTNPPAQIEPGYDTGKWKVFDGRFDKNFLAQLRSSLGDDLKTSRFFRVGYVDEECDDLAGDCSSDVVYATKNHTQLQLITDRLVTVKNRIIDKKEREQLSTIIEKFRGISRGSDREKWYEKIALSDGFGFAAMGVTVAWLYKKFFRGGRGGGADGADKSHKTAGQGAGSGLKGPRLYEARAWRPPPHEKPLEKDWLVYTVEFLPAAAFSAAGLARGGIGLILEEFAGKFTFDGLAASAAVFAF